MLSNLVDLQGFLQDTEDGSGCLVLLDRVGLHKIEGLGGANGTRLGVTVGCCSFSWTLGAGADTTLRHG